MPKYSNNDIAHQIEQMSKSFQDFKKEDFRDFKQEVRDRFEDIDTNMQPFNKFMIVQQDRQARKANGSINWGEIAKQASVIIGTALLIILTVLNYVLNGTKP